MQVSVGDMVFRGEEAGEVQGCIAFAGDLYALVKAFVRGAAVTATSHRWAPVGTLVAWPAAELEQAAAWHCSGGAVVVLRM